MSEVAQAPHSSPDGHIPQLRFPEFSGAWEGSTLGDVATITTGSTPSTLNNEYYNGDIAFVSPADIQGNRLVCSTKITITELGLSTVRAIKKKSTLFVCIGSTIGKVAQAGINCATNQQINALTANKSFDNDFIYSLLEFKAPGIKRLAGVQAVPQINKSEFSRFKFTFPLLLEQQKIAAFLTAVDTKIEQLSKKQALLGKYKKGLMQQIFSQAIRFKADDGSDFPDWEEKSLGDLSLSYYQGINTTADKVEYHKEGFPIIQAKHITSEFMDFNNIRYVNEATYESYKKKFKPNQNDILISNIGTLGKIVLVENDIDFLVAWNIFKVELDINKVMPKFLLFALKLAASRGYFDRMKTGNATKFVNKADTLNIPINLPSKLEQTKIANFLSSIDNKIEQVGKQLDESKQFKKALLQQMFV